MKKLALILVLMLFIGLCLAASPYEFNRGGSREAWRNVLNDWLMVGHDANGYTRDFNQKQDILTNTSDVNVRDINVAGTLTVVGPSDLNDVNTVNLYVEGVLGQRAGDYIANTNDPNGTTAYPTAYALKVYDVNGTLMGYIPVYTNEW